MDDLNSLSALTPFPVGEGDGVGNDSGVDLDVWHKRIRAARTRRERYENDWAQYARLHTNVYRAMRDANDGENVVLPSGDQVKVGLVHRNLEQTLAVLDVPEVSVKAAARDFTRELDGQDLHRESIVESALQDSLQQSGLLAGPEVADAVKRDALICGHGVIYTWWRRVVDQIPGDPVMQLALAEDGSFAPELDGAGQPLYAREMTEQVRYEAVQDEHVPVLEFLFDAAALSIDAARWHGREVITHISAVEAEGYTLPEDLPSSAWRRKTLYGEDPSHEEMLEADSVKRITVWDKDTQTLLDFIETSTAPSGRKNRDAGTASHALYLLDAKPWPVTFDHPDKSPFESLIPIPANDHPFGVSQVEHIRIPALEADKLRTRMANLTREQKTLLMYTAGVIDDDELKRAMKSPEGEAVKVKKPEDVKWDEIFKVIQGSGIPREVYEQIKLAADDVRWISGVSEMPFGGAETATESENQSMIGGARTNRKRSRYLKFLSRVAETHRCLLREFAPSGQTIVVPNFDGTPMTLEYGREAFQGRFQIRVMAGEAGMSPVRQKFLSDMFGQMFGKFGPAFDLALLRQALTVFDVKDAESLVRAARQGLMPALMPGAMPGLPPPPPGAAPRPATNPNDISNGQAIRSAMNSIIEGGRR